MNISRLRLAGRANFACLSNYVNLKRKQSEEKVLYNVLGYDYIGENSPHGLELIIRAHSFDSPATRCDPSGMNPLQTLVLLLSLMMYVHVHCLPTGLERTKIDGQITGCQTICTRDRSRKIPCATYCQGSRQHSSRYRRRWVCLTGFISVQLS